MIEKDSARLSKPWWKGMIKKKKQFVERFFMICGLLSNNSLYPWKGFQPRQISKTLWVNRSIRYYSRSAKSVGNFHGYNVTRIICDRVSVDIYGCLSLYILAMQSRNRRDAFLCMDWGFLSYATSKLNAIRCIAPLLCLGVIDSWVPNDYQFPFRVASRPRPACSLLYLSADHVAWCRDMACHARSRVHDNPVDCINLCEAIKG